MICMAASFMTSRPSAAISSCASSASSRWPVSITIGRFVRRAIAAATTVEEAPAAPRAAHAPPCSSREISSNQLIKRIVDVIGACMDWPTRHVST